MNKIYFFFLAREAPAIEIHPREPQTVRLGESAMLSCRSVAGIPLPTIVWARRDNSPFSANVKEEYPGTIIIHNITSAEAGVYECRGSNIAGDVSQTATIIVQEAPQIRIIPDQQELVLTEGDELKLECLATGDPQPNVKWKEPFSLEVAGVPGFESYAGRIEPRAIIHKYNIERYNEGTYVCYASNDAGTEERYISVVVQPKRGDVGMYSITRFKQFLFFFIFQLKLNLILMKCYKKLGNSEKVSYNDIKIKLNFVKENNFFFNSGPYDKDEVNTQPPYPQPNPWPYPSERPPYPNRPEQYKVAIGDRTKISCHIDNDNKQTSWRRLDGQPLPRNSRLVGGDLIIEYTQEDAAGIYECVVHERDGVYPIVKTELTVIGKLN